MTKAEIIEGIAVLTALLKEDIAYEVRALAQEKLVLLLKLL